MGEEDKHTGLLCRVKPHDHAPQDNETLHRTQSPFPSAGGLMFLNCVKQAETMEGNMKFDGQTGGNPNWEAEIQRKGLQYSLGSVSQVGLMEQLLTQKEIPGVTFTVWEIPAYVRPRTIPIGIQACWRVQGQEELAPRGSKMQQGSGWIWITLRIP